MTPVPKRIHFVRSAAAAMKISGDAMISLPGRVVLADPRLVEAEGVEVLDELEITLQRQRRVGTRAVERGDEISKPELRH